MRYQCRVSDDKGKISQRQVECEDSSSLSSILAKENLYLLSWKKGKEKKGGRKKPRAVLELTQSLSLMIRSGLSLKDSFEIARGLFREGSDTQRLISELSRTVDKGDSFARAVEKHSHLFPDLYIGMVQVGQKVGHLDEIFPRLARWLKEDKEMKDRILGALIYPALILLMVFTGVMALLFIFLPHLEGMMGYGTAESAETLMQTVQSAKGLVYLMAGLVLLIPLFLLLRYLSASRWPALKAFLDRIQLKIPLLGSFVRTREMLSLNFALSILTQCSVPLEEALTEAAGVLNNRCLQEAVIQTQKRLLKGDPLSELAGQQKEFPAEFSRWISVGERIGNVEAVFDQLKDFYDDEMKKKLNRLTTLVEPVIILLLGLFLVIIIFKVILPLLTLYGGMV